MKETIFEGSGVAIITPMNEDKSINHTAFEEIIDFQLENGTDAIIACGTTGESATLSDDEYYSVVKCAANRVNKRVPVIAGAGSNNTIHAIELSLRAKSAGADALLIVTPYYNKTSQKGLVEHYKLIAENVELPIILYNVPSRTGCNINPETCLELSKIPNIVGIKEASGNISNVAKILSLCDKDFKVYSGNDDQIVPIMSLGGSGVISVFANVCPKECHDITSLALKGEISKAAEMQLKYLDLINVLFCDVNPIPVKEAMNMLGYDCGRCRLPLTTLNEENLNKLREMMKKYDII